MNLILLVNLAWSAVLYVRFLGARMPFAGLGDGRPTTCIVYAAWAAIVVIVFPPAFNTSDSGRSGAARRAAPRRASQCAAAKRCSWTYCSTSRPRSAACTSGFRNAAAAARAREARFCLRAGLRRARPGVRSLPPSGRRRLGQPGAALFGRPRAVTPAVAQAPSFSTMPGSGESDLDVLGVVARTVERHSAFTRLGRERPAASFRLLDSGSGRVARSRCLRWG